MAKILNFQRARVHAKERKTPAGEVFPAEPNDPPLSPAAQLRTYLAVQRQMVEAVTRPRTRPVSTDREQKKPFIPEGKVRELQEGGLFVERDLSPFSLSAYVGQEAIKQDLRGRIERIKRDPQLTVVAYLR